MQQRTDGDPVLPIKMLAKTGFWWVFYFPIDFSSSLKVGQNTFCNGSFTMQMPTFYKVVKISEKTVWLIELESQLIEHDDYGQVGH